MSADSPSISVVVPAYNAGWSIGRTIASVLAQTYRQFELIIIDDGSTEDMKEAIEEAAKGDPRVRVVRQANRGLAAARNRGTLEARAPLVAMLDSDDVWGTRFLEKTYAVLSENSDAPFAFGWSLRMDEADQLLSMPRWKQTPRHDLPGLLAFNSVGNGSSALFRKAALDQIGGYDETLASRHGRGAEDWKLVLRLADLGDPIAIPEFLVGYRRVASSMSQQNPLCQLKSVLGVIEDIRIEHPEMPRRWFNDARTAMVCWLLPRIIEKGQWAYALRMAAVAYVANPLSFRSTEIRRMHTEKISAMSKSLFSKLGLLKRQSPQHLSDLVLGGERPFAYLRRQ